MRRTFPAVLRYAALAAHPGGREESAFPDAAGGLADVRYCGPQTEVSFCGHATIAAAVAFAERVGPGALRLRTAAGPVRVETAARAGSVGRPASLTATGTRR